MIGDAAEGLPQSRVAAVVLAAGQATRMGAQKLLLPVGGRPMVRRVAEAALGSRVMETIVVVGHEPESLRTALEGLPVKVVVNPDYEAGMSTSLRAGLRAIGDEADGVLILLGDQPFVTPALLDRLIDVHTDDGARIVRLAVGDRPANPVLMSADLFPELLAQQGDVGGRDVAARHAEEVQLVPVDDASVMDVDTAEDYRLATEHG